MKFIIKLIKQLIICLIILILIFFIFFGYIVLKNEKDFRNSFTAEEQFTNNDKLYTPKNEYEKEYPINEYVNEQLEQNSLIRNNLVKGLVNSQEIIEGSNFERLFIIGKEILQNKYDINKIIGENQYPEETRVKLMESGQNFYNYKYSGEYKNKKISGKIALNGSKNNMALAISFDNLQGQLDVNNLLFFMDDSNTEMLAYLIIEELNKMYDLNKSPDEISKHFFNCTFEQLAGSISYHAITSYIVLKNNGNATTLQHSEEVNIGKIDSDGFYVNRSY